MAKLRAAELALDARLCMDKAMRVLYCKRCFYWRVHASAPARMAMSSDNKLAVTVRAADEHTRHPRHLNLSQTVTVTASTETKEGTCQAKSASHGRQGQGNVKSQHCCIAGWRSYSCGISYLHVANRAAAVRVALTAVRRIVPRDVHWPCPVGQHGAQDHRHRPAGRRRRALNELSNSLLQPAAPLLHSRQLLGLIAILLPQELQHCDRIAPAKHRSEGGQGVCRHFKLAQQEQLMLRVVPPIPWDGVEPRLRTC